MYGETGRGSARQAIVVNTRGYGACRRWCATYVFRGEERTNRNRVGARRSATRVCARRVKEGSQMWSRHRPAP